MFAQLLLGGLCFAAGLATLFAHLIAEPAKETVEGLLTAAIYLGAIAYTIRLALDQPADPTIRQETRP